MALLKCEGTYDGYEDHWEDEWDYEDYEYHLKGSKSRAILEDAWDFDAEADAELESSRHRVWL